jgi:hypothetical protein
MTKIELGEVSKDQHTKTEILRYNPEGSEEPYEICSWRTEMTAVR